MGEGWGGRPAARHTSGAPSNEHIERWVDALLEDNCENARGIAARLDSSDDTIAIAIVRDLGSAKAWAYPAIANGKLYIRDVGSLWCYDVKAN